MKKKMGNPIQFFALMMENSLVCHLSYNGATTELTRKAKNAHKLYHGNLIRENTFS